MFDVKFIAATAAAVLALASPQAARSQGSEPPATGPTPQNPTGTPGQPGATTPAPTPPAPTPAPSASQPGAATAPQPGAQPTLSDAQKRELGTVWTHNQLLAGIGDLAGSRGSSDEVKNLARWISGDHKNLTTDLSARLKERGVSDPAALPAPPDAQGLKDELQRLGGRSGEDFDRAFLAYVKLRGPGFVDALKRARDATPGKDAALKKALDEAEDRAEAHLAAGRQLDSRRAQARTPPKR